MLKKMSTSNHDGLSYASRVEFERVGMCRRIASHLERLLKIFGRITHVGFQQLDLQ
jgi:hypothetical protein